MDIFNKKRLEKLQREKNYYQDLLVQKNNTINRLQENNSELNKHLDNIIRENKKLIDWIYKILENYGTMDVNESSVHIPIYKNIRPKPAYDSGVSPYMSGKVKTIVIPQITISRFEGE